MLTVKELRAAKPGEWVSDGGTRGAGMLLFRRAASGALLAYFRYTGSDGKRDTLALGSFDETGKAGMSLAQARARAAELSKLYQGGTKDIRGHLEAQAAAEVAAREAAQAAEAEARREVEQRARFTLAALLDGYVRHLERQGKASWRDVRSVFRVHVLEAAPDLAGKPAKDVTGHDVAALVRRVREKGAERTAGILRAYLRAAFGLAAQAPFDSAAPAGLIGFNIESNPAELVPAIAVKARERTLSPAELRGYLKALGGSLADRALRLALLAGGQRAAQLLRVRLSDFDAEIGTLRLMDAKGRRTQAREHLLPVGPLGLALVEALAAEARGRAAESGDADPLLLPVVPGTLSHRVQGIAADMGGAPFEMRDIRRTCETMLAGLGINRETRAQILSHGLGGVQAMHYDRHSYMDEKRSALEAWEQKLDDIESGKAQEKRGKVVNLRRK